MVTGKQKMEIKSLAERWKEEEEPGINTKVGMTANC